MQIGFQFLRFQVEFNPPEAVPLALTFAVYLGFGYPVRRHDFDPAAIFFGEVITQLFFQFFGVGDFFHRIECLPGWPGNVQPAGCFRKL